MRIEIDRLIFTPPSPQMTAWELLALRGQDPQYWIVELIDSRDMHGRIWGQEAPRSFQHGETYGGGWDDLHRPLDEPITLTDGMRFGTLPPCGYSRETR